MTDDEVYKCQFTADVLRWAAQVLRVDPVTSLEDLAEKGRRGST